MTVAQAHQQAKQKLIAAGQTASEARLAARVLLDAAMSTPHAHLSRGEAVLEASQQVRFEMALEELKGGRPLAYVLGERQWFGLKFRCDERALIPRPETELLVETALKEIRNWQLATGNLKIADLGTGTGCIAVALAMHLPCAEIYATDISTGALELAHCNASTHSVEERIRFIAGEAQNWASPLLQFKRKFDLILSNPPYIAARDLETLPPQICEWEPRPALTPGDDALQAYRQIAAGCRVLLKPDGALLCELGAGQYDEVRAIFQGHNWQVAEPIFDLAAIARVLLARPAS